MSLRIPSIVIFNYLPQLQRMIGLRILNPSKCPFSFVTRSTYKVHKLIGSLSLSFISIMAYNSVAKQRPRNKNETTATAIQRRSVSM
jgi:hypothetical protein